MLTAIDWIIIASFLLLSLAIGLYYRRNAGKSIADFFLGGRNLSWYIAGLSMVATTFAADTPLAVSELVAQGGIAKNWLWWSFVFGGALTTFFFAMLWRRSGVLTELEFITLRYEGVPARFLRIFKSVYLGLFINAVIIAWVNLAMVSLLEVFFELGRAEALTYTFALMVIAVFYSALSGLTGVAVTDAFQFAIAMAGCIVLAVLVVTSDEIGGVAMLKTKLPQGATDFFPSVSQPEGMELLHGFGLTIGAFLSFIGIQWWASWYPGAEPGGGGYIAQRMMSTRSEADSVWATLLFQVGHYCIRPWPWIIVSLCAIALYSPAVNDPVLEKQLSYFSTPHQEDQLAFQPERHAAEVIARGSGNAADFLELYPSYKGTPAEQSIRYHYEPRLGFVFTMRDFLPPGLTGLLLVAFMAAYLSTISTQVNWGASYLVNDFIKPSFKDLSEKKLVLGSRVCSILVMIAGAIITPFVTSISGVWEFILQCGAGTGLVLILRWYWWRINAWSEITATIAPLLSYSFCTFYLNERMGDAFVANNGAFYVTVLFTTVAWLLVTYLTPPPSQALVTRFNEQVKPMGLWPSYTTGVSERNKSLKWLVANWAAMVTGIISVLFAIGSFVLLEFPAAFLYTALALLSIFSLRMFLKKTNIFGRNSEPR